MRLLEFSHILNRMLTRNKAEVALLLDAEIFEDDFHLVVLADHVVFLVAVLLRLLGVVIVLVARRQWEARVALEQIPDSVELLPELLFALVVLDVLEQFVDDTPKAPEVRSLVV